MIVAYNARDFGFSYFYIDRARSENISSKSAKEPASINQYIHCGGSCGYPGGCNNMSPDQSELKIKVSALPAEAHIKLWKNKPAGKDQAPDMTFVITMI